MPKCAGVKPSLHFNPASAWQKYDQLAATAAGPGDFYRHPPLRFAARRFLLSISHYVAGKRLQGYVFLLTERLAP